MRLKDMFYNNVVRPAVFYGSKCWAVDKKIEQRMSEMSVAEMRMFRWTSGGKGWQEKIG